MNPGLDQRLLGFLEPGARQIGSNNWVMGPKSSPGGGSHPMGGSGETLYRAVYGFNQPFGVTTSASLRLVVDLADDDKVLAVLGAALAVGGIALLFL